MDATPSAGSVREHLALGRLLPLGTDADRIWIAERAVAGVLRDAARTVPGIRLGALRVERVPGAPAPAMAAGAPPSALPPGPLRVVADFAADPRRSLPASAALLRRAMAAAADTLLGLEPAAIDLAVTGLLDAPADGGAPRVLPPAGPGDRAVGPSVPGALRITPAAPPGGYVCVTVERGRCALEVARAVRAAMPAAVLVTGIA